MVISVELLGGLRRAVVCWRTLRVDDLCLSHEVKRLCCWLNAFWLVLCWPMWSDGVNVKDPTFSQSLRSMSFRKDITKEGYERGRVLGALSGCGKEGFNCVARYYHLPHACSLLSYGAACHDYILASAALLGTVANVLTDCAWFPDRHQYLRRHRTF